MTNLLSGDFTVDDYRLFDFLRDLKKTENVEIEPSSCAAFIGPCRLTVYSRSKEYLKKQGLTEEKLANATQIAWATGGRLVPPSIREEYLNTYLKK